MGQPGEIIKNKDDEKEKPARFVSTFKVEADFLQICDDGHGFDLAQVTPGFGLCSMRERTLALGGWFEIKSSPSGACLEVTLPAGVQEAHERS